MISDLSTEECFELLTSTTVGRVGFVMDERVQIFPVNYRASGKELFLRTSSDGILNRLADEHAQVSFEVDFHDDLSGTGWSVLMHGRLATMADETQSGALTKVSPWAGNERVTALHLAIDTITGRRVRRDRR
jgi:nitroimidazol reductase NimA-like FMN-containing flavoprotein (pyridoxamine 5'-phosphate oxidase superfamily)